MTNEELNTALYKKMFTEQEKYTAWLLTQTPEAILMHSYEYTAREDLLLSLEYNDLSNKQAEALLASDSPLKEAYSAFEQREGDDYMTEVFSSLESAAESLIREKQLADQAPLYRETAAYAREHDELDAYRASYQANVACKEAIEKAIHEHYHDNRLDTSCVQEIIDRFGQERVEHVLATTVSVKSWDQRFSDSNRVWAVTHCIPEDDSGMGDRRSRIVVDQCHPGLTDLFISAFRREVRQAEQAREQPKRESVLALLNQPVPARSTKKVHKSKAMER